MQEKTILSSIIDFIFGRKYYATIFNTRGTTTGAPYTLSFPIEEMRNAFYDVFYEDIIKIASLL